MIPPCAQSLFACNGAPKESSSTLNPAFAASNAYAEPARPAPSTRQSVWMIFILLFSSSCAQQKMTKHGLFSPERTQVQAEIRGGHGVRERPDADDVHTGQGVLAQGLIAHAAGDLDLGAAGNHPHGCANLHRGH